VDARQQQSFQRLIQNNQLQQARALCQQLSQQQPTDIDAWFNLGLVHAQLGQLDLAYDNFRQVLKLDGRDQDSWYNLGRIAAMQEQLDEAVRCYQQAIEIQPDYVEAYFSLGNLYKDHQQTTKAIEHYRRTIHLQSSHFKAHANLALLLLSQGEIDNAISHLKTALDLQPNSAELQFFMGNALLDQNNTPAAILHFRRALKLRADYHEACHKLGVALYQCGKLEEAEQSLRQFLQAHPQAADAYNNLGVVLNARGLLVAAEHAFRQALEREQDYAAAHNNLGIALRNQGKLSMAIEHFRLAQQLDPHNADIRNNLGDIFKEQGKLDAAIEHYQEALKLRPEFHQVHSNLLFILSYNVLYPPEEMYEAHLAWDKIQGKAGKALAFKHTPDKKTVEQRLRIGYVSPDFNDHAVSFFLEPILKAHNRQQVEVFCYAEVNNPDAVTRRLQAQADHWRSTVGLSDEAVAQLIFADGIDVLIDLAGHTAGNRLKAFTYKPAPVQATYLGYFTTTGLATMDYWITDEVLTPMDTVELATETCYRLPRCCLTYQASAAAPDIVQPDHEHITFGSFNQISKMSADAIALWSAVLRAVPDSKLLIKAKQLADMGVQSKVQQQFAEHGIAAERLILLSATASYREHLAIYGQVDIALDTIPRTGGSTTADALWMGVPVITLAGERFIERLSASMLNALDLEELITHSREDYVACAVALAQDPDRRRILRASLRQRMAHSPLCDATGLARALERAYRTMWQRFLDSPMDSA